MIYSAKCLGIVTLKVKLREKTKNADSLNEAKQN